MGVWLDHERERLREPSCNGELQRFDWAEEAQEGEVARATQPALRKSGLNQRKACSTHLEPVSSPQKQAQEHKCMHVTYVCVHACMNACMHACMHGWMDGWNVCMYVCMYVCNVRMRACIARMHACMHPCMHACRDVMYVCMYYCNVM